MSILATNAYRSLIAAAVAAGGSVPEPTEIAFGTGTTEPSVDDTELETELVRKDLGSVSVDGMTVNVTGALLGTESGVSVITEMGVFAADGTLMGRRTFAPKTLEPESRIDFDLDFSF